MKTEFLKSEKYPLSGGYYTIERVGQEKPHISDEILVKGTIFLPTAGRGEGDYTHLKLNLLFKRRVQILKMGLYSNWGEFNFNGYRDRSFYIKRSKWSGAFKEAQEYAEQELQKLEDALAARAKALEDAEND